MASLCVSTKATVLATFHFLTPPYLFLILIFFLSCFYHSFDHFGSPRGAYFLFFPTGFLRILSSKAFHQQLPRGVFSVFCTHRGRHASQVSLAEAECDVGQTKSSEIECSVLRAGGTPGGIFVSLCLLRRKTLSPHCHQLCGPKQLLGAHLQMLPFSLQPSLFSPGLW